jgi:hypothetical protein
VQPAVLRVERVAALDVAARQQHSFRAGVRDLHVGGDAVGAVQHVGGRGGRDQLCARVVGVAGAILGDRRPFVGEPGGAAAVNRQDVVLAGLGVPESDQLDHCGRVGDVGGVSEFLAGEALAAEHAPPGFLQVEPAGVLRDEYLPDSGMSGEPFAGGH